MTYDIRSVDDATGIAQIRHLFRTYGQWVEQDLGVSLDFQGFEEELASLPGKYAPPRGGMWLAITQDGSAVGCVALRPFDERSGEIKRLYVRPEHRRAGLGRALTLRAMDAADRQGYARLLLDTGPTMLAAQALYADLGFHEVPPYYDNPVPGCLFLERLVAPDPDQAG